ncbi:MAG: hypothetical protein AVO33_10650 [delta proteobacterium ML8_F1]|nr:MAG: hypothetical protein AVO33_10650 [delta proteobacterium ML8_F1]
MKIRDYKRFIISLTLILLLGTGTLNLAFSLIPAHGDEIRTYTTYEVVRGDTVWDIARSHTQKDVRDLVYEISVVNNLKNFVIKPGDILRIPDNF